MVNRREIGQKATVVDLDGTYIDGNTLIVYVATGLRSSLRRLRLGCALRVAWWVALRQLRLTSHRRMKAEVIRSLGFEPGHMAEFSARCLARVNPEVRRLIDNDLSQGKRVLLATAAPEGYVDYLWKGDYVATHIAPDGTMLVECRGEEKLRRVEAWLAREGCELETVVTDHADDAPLLLRNAGGRNILVKPDTATRSFIENHPDIQAVVIK